MVSKSTFPRVPISQNRSHGPVSWPGVRVALDTAGLRSQSLCPTVHWGLWREGRGSAVPEVLVIRVFGPLSSFGRGMERTMVGQAGRVVPYRLLLSSFSCYLIFLILQTFAPFPPTIFIPLRAERVSSLLRFFPRCFIWYLTHC